MNLISIYELINPDTYKPFYIGKTKQSLKERLRGHISDSRRYKNNHAVYLQSLSKKPIINLIDIVVESQWRFWETYWISQYRTWGFDIINVTDGGTGATAKTRINKYIPSQETLQKVLSRQVDIGYTKKVYRIDPNYLNDDCENGIIIFPSLGSAAISINKDRKSGSSLIRRACKLKYAKCEGYYWMFAGQSLLDKFKEIEENVNLKGKKNGISVAAVKFNSSEIKEIRELAKQGKSYKYIAQLFNTSIGYCNHIINRRAWKNV